MCDAVTARGIAYDGSGVTVTLVITIKRKINDPLIAIVDHNVMKFPIDESSRSVISLNVDWSRITLNQN